MLGGDGGVRSPGRVQDEVSEGPYPHLAGGVAHHEVGRAQLFRPVPVVELPEKLPDPRLLPDLTRYELFHHAPEPRAAAPGGTEDPYHVLRTYAVRPSTLRE